VGLVADQEVGDHLVDLVEVDLVVEETKVGAQEVLEEVQDLVADQEVADHLVDPLPPDPPVDDDTPLPLFPKANAFGSKLPTKY
jgi:hypothetical protein